MNRATKTSHFMTGFVVALATFPGDAIIAQTTPPFVNVVWTYAAPCQDARGFRIGVRFITRRKGPGALASAALNASRNRIPHVIKSRDTTVTHLLNYSPESSVSRWVESGSVWSLGTIREISCRLWFSKLAFQADYHVLIIPHRIPRLRSEQTKYRKGDWEKRRLIYVDDVFSSWWPWLSRLILDVWRNLLGFIHWLHATLVQLTVTGVGLSTVSS